MSKKKSGREPFIEKYSNEKFAIDVKMYSKIIKY